MAIKYFIANMLLSYIHKEVELTAYFEGKTVCGFLAMHFAIQEQGYVQKHFAGANMETDLNDSIDRK